MRRMLLLAILGVAVAGVIPAYVRVFHERQMWLVFLSGLLTAAVGFAIGVLWGRGRRRKGD